MKRLRENAMLEAEISPEGDVVVEGHHVGKLDGFRFTTDTVATGADAKAAASAATKALATEITKRAERLSAAPNGDVALGSDGTLRWLGVPVGKLASTDDILKPRVTILADEQLTGSHRDMVQHRLDRWLSNHVDTILKPLVDLPADDTLTGTSRGVAFRIVEQLGSVDRREISTEVQGLDQDTRARIRRHGVRFGAYSIFIPALLKPAPAELICILWGLKNDRLDAPGLTEIPNMSAAGRTSFPLDKNIEPEIYRLCGFRLLGDKAVRIDILERLADLIRPAVSWRPVEGAKPPEGAIGNRTFYVTPAMLSFLGATHADMEKVLKDLGYRSETKSLEEFEKLKPVQKLETPEQNNPRENSDTVKAGDGATSDANSKPAIQSAPLETVADAAQQTSSIETAELKSPGEGEANAAAATVGEQANTPIDAVTKVDDDKSELTPDSAKDESDTVKTVTIWRTPRQERGNFRQNRADKTPHGRKGTDRKHTEGSNDQNFSGSKKSNKANRGDQSGDRHNNRKSRSGTKPRPERREKRIDPDSPFAKLMDLKKQLEKDDG